MNYLTKLFSSLFDPTTDEEGVEGSSTSNKTKKSKQKGCGRSKSMSVSPQTAEVKISDPELIATIKRRRSSTFTTPDNSLRANTDISTPVGGVNFQSMLSKLTGKAKSSSKSTSRQSTVEALEMSRNKTIDPFELSKLYRSMDSDNSEDAEDGYEEEGFIIELKGRTTKELLLTGEMADKVIIPSTDIPITLIYLFW